MLPILQSEESHIFDHCFYDHTQKFADRIARSSEQKPQGKIILSS